MQPERWRQAWRDGRTGFHREAVHPDLLAQAEWFVAGGRRVLVPLCGMTVDLQHLAGHGLEVVGVELSGLAIGRLFEREGWPPAVDVHGPFRRHRAGRVTVLEGDIFDLDPTLVGTFDRVWDRAALVALPPEMRARYVPQIRRLAAPGARLLQNAFTYAPGLREGPPFSVPADEVGRLYSGAAIERARHEPLEVAGGEFMVSTYRITL